MPCPPKGLENCGKANFKLCVKNKYTGEIMPGVVLLLQCNDCPLFSLKSGKSEVIKLPSICPGTYTLALSRAPEGFTPCEKLPTLRVTPKGNLRLEGKTQQLLTIYFCAQGN